MATKGCHAVSFHSDTHRFGLPDHHGDEWDPAWQAVPGHRHGDGVPLRELAGVHAPIAVRHDDPHHAVQHGRLRRRAAVVAGPAQVPEREVLAGRGRHRMDPVLAGARGLHLPAPPPVDGPGLRGPAAQPGVQGSGARPASSTTTRACACATTSVSRTSRGNATTRTPTAPGPTLPSRPGSRCRQPRSPTTRSTRSRGRTRAGSSTSIPLAHRAKERCTVGALRAEAVDVDVTPKSYGMPERSGPPVAALPELSTRRRAGPAVGPTTAPGRSAPVDRLDLRELLQAVVAPLAADAALLEPTEGAALADAGHGLAPARAPAHRRARRRSADEPPTPWASTVPARIRRATLKARAVDSDSTPPPSP